MGGVPGIPAPSALRVTSKQNLLDAAEANGIKVYKSWTKARLWKALISA